MKLTMQAVPIRFLCLLFSCLLLQAASVQGADSAPRTVWTCSMHPQIQLPEAGKCPICFMDLIEVKKESGKDRASLRQIRFDSRAQKLAEVEVQAVGYGDARTEIRMVGKVDYDETRVGTITSWVNGRIDKLFVDYTGSRVERGQPMVKVYSPELLTAQAELIQASEALRRTEASGNEIIRKTAGRTLTASREKLRLLGLSDTQLSTIEQQGRPTDHITLTAPQSGIVIKKNVNEGMYVKTGSPIYTLADLDRVWVVLEAYESDIRSIALGQKVRFSVEAYPGTPFQGEVAYIDPLVDSATRTVRVRLNVDNRDARLKPGMFVRAVSSVALVTDAKDRPLLIPASAPLVTGKRALVYVQLPGEPGVYVGREVVLGARQGDFYQVKLGLKAGELVVTRGNFKIDSAIQLQARPSMMNPYIVEKGPTDSSPPPLFLSRLILLNSEFVLFSKALHTGNREQWQAGLKKFAGILGEVSDEGLQGNEKLGWRELSMLLGSDILLLTEAENRVETDRLYGVMAGHFYQLRELFQLPNVGGNGQGSAALRSLLSDLLVPYLGLQKGLAAGDYKAAEQQGRILSEKARDLMSSLQESTDTEQLRLIKSLDSEVRTLTSALDLAKIRKAFYPLSKTFAELIGLYGVNGEAPLYIQFCPMAFSNAGATWISGTKEINNPYFGPMMLRCGEVQKQIK